MTNPDLDERCININLMGPICVNYIQGKPSPLASEPVENISPVRGETALWQAVITQALMDASNRSEKVEAQHHRREATAWLRGNTQDFVTVCLFAGLEPEWVREQAQNAMARGFRWRAKAILGAHAHCHGRAITNPRTFMAVAPGAM